MLLALECRNQEKKRLLQFPFTYSAISVRNFPEKCVSLLSFASFALLVDVATSLP
jgi:hypothetical protein